MTEETNHAGNTDTRGDGEHVRKREGEAETKGPEQILTVSLFLFPVPKLEKF